MNSWINETLLTDCAYAEDFLHRTITSLGGSEDPIVRIEGSNIFGEKIYGYIKINKILYHELKRRIALKDKFDLREYGEVIAVGLEETQGYKDHFEISRTYNMLPFAKK